MMNTQNLDTAMLSSAAQPAARPTLAETGHDAFSRSLLLWMASFPLFIAGLLLAGGSWHTIGYVLQLAAAVCFLSPVTQLLGCVTEK